jgi:hypothetical protein
MAHASLEKEVHMSKKLDKLAEKAELVSALCADPRLSGDQLRVAVALLFTFHNTKTGKCCPSHHQLAKASATCETTSKSAIKKLKAMGVIEFEPNNGGRSKRNRYTVNGVSSGQENHSPSGPFQQENQSPSGPLASRPADPLAAETSRPADPHRTQEIIKPGNGTREEGALANASAPLDHAPVVGLTVAGVKNKNKTASRAQARAARGTRLPEDWRPSEKDLEVARRIGMPEPMIARAQFKFRNHWVAKTGRDATKLDWHATWCNWIVGDMEKLIKDQQPRPNAMSAMNEALQRRRSA